MAAGASIRAFIHIVELRTKVISMTTFVSAVLYSRYAGEEVRLPLLLLMTAAVLLVDMGTTAFNSFFDYVRGVDHRAHTREEDKLLVKGEASPGAALLISVLLYVGAVACGLAVAFLTGIEVALAGALCMAVGFLYNAGPLPLSSTPFGELFAGGFLGSVLFLISCYVFQGTLTAEALLVSLPFTLYIASILTVNNTCDMEGDAEAGRKTLVVLCGSLCGRILIYLLGFAAYGSLLVLAAVRMLPAEVFWTVPPAAAAAAVGYVRMDRRGYSHLTKGANMSAVVRLFALFGAAVLAALAFSLL
jgi:1,4-dihydroxy-2-naphthoate octaprenyltransferase